MLMHINTGEWNRTLMQYIYIYMHDLEAVHQVVESYHSYSAQLFRKTRCQQLRSVAPTKLPKTMAQSTLLKLEQVSTWFRHLRYSATITPTLRTRWHMQLTAPGHYVLFESLVGWVRQNTLKKLPDLHIHVLPWKPAQHLCSRPTGPARDMITQLWGPGLRPSYLQKSLLPYSHLSCHPGSSICTGLIDLVSATVHWRWHTFHPGHNECGVLAVRTSVHGAVHNYEVRANHWQNGDQTEGLWALGVIDSEREKSVGTCWQELGCQFQQFLCPHDWGCMWANPMHAHWEASLESFPPNSHSCAHIPNANALSLLSLSKYSSGADQKLSVGCTGPDPLYLGHWLTCRSVTCLSEQHDLSLIAAAPGSLRSRSQHGGGGACVLPYRLVWQPVYLDVCCSRGCKQIYWSPPIVVSL